MAQAFGLETVYDGDYPLTEAPIVFTSPEPITGKRSMASKRPPDLLSFRLLRAFS